MLWDLGLSRWEYRRLWSRQSEWLISHDIVFSFHLVASGMHRLWLKRSCCELDWLSFNIFRCCLNRDSVLIQVELDVQMVEDLVVYCLVVTPDA